VHDVPAVRGGVFGLFCTNSNDMALGIPLIGGLYSGADAAFFMNYLFVFAVAQNLILNPISFFVLEFGKIVCAREQGCAGGGEQEVAEVLSTTQITLKVLKSLTKNPVIIVVFLGLLSNLLFGHEAITGTVVEKIFTLQGDAFACGALILTGCSIVGKTDSLKGNKLAIPVFLSVAKSLLLPILARYLVIAAGAPDALVNFMVVFFTIPTAASTLVFARQFDVEPDLVAGGSVLNLVLSAPMMFMTAMLVAASSSGIIYWSQVLRVVSNTLSIVGTLVLLVFFWLVPRWHVYPMLLLKDTAIMSFFFSSLHLTCTEFGNETAITSYATDAVIYFAVNSFRLAERMYALCVAVILLSTCRLALAEGKSVWDLVEFPPARTWQKWHMRARVAAFTYGVGVTAFFTLPEFSNSTAYLGCWFRHGAAQIYVTIAVELPITVVLIIILSYSQLHPSANANYRKSVESKYLALPASHRMPSTEMSLLQMQESIGHGVESSTEASELHHRKSTSSAADADAELAAAYVQMGDDGDAHDSEESMLWDNSGMFLLEEDHSAPLRQPTAPPRTSWKFLAGVYIGCEVVRNVLSLLVEITIVVTNDDVYTLPTVVYLLFILTAFVDGGGFLLFLTFGLQSDATAAVGGVLKAGLCRLPSTRQCAVYGMFLVVAFTLVGLEALLPNKERELIN
jgi:predicted permease